MDKIICQKISYALRGRKKTATTRKRISQALRNQRKTEEHKKAISEAMRAKWEERKNNNTKTDKDE